ncbi:MAG TPA: redoxin family protein [Candidatus Kryptonia bacterium]|nr:redoxin family protein [Candidatus Kryptonia bacterium]
MKNRIVLALFSAAAFATTVMAADSVPQLDPAAAGIGQKVPAFTAQAVDLTVDPPRTSTVDSSAAKRITAYIFVGVTCPATNAYAERFKQLAQTYSPKGVDFVYLYPNRNDTPEAKRDFHKSKQLGGRMIDDQGGKLAQEFRAQKTSELFLADKQGKIVYHGAADDSRDPNAVKQHYLADALDELLTGKQIAMPASQVFA